MLKKIPSDKINVIKNALFFLSRALSHRSFTFNLQFLYKLKLKVHMFKTVCEVFNACTQAAICSFYTEIRNFTVVPRRPFVSYSEIQNFENCAQTAIRFSQRNKKFIIAPKLLFIL